MKKRLLSGALLMLLLAVAPAAAQGGGTKPFTLSITDELKLPNQVSISLSGDRSKYVIRVNGTVKPTNDCTNPTPTQINVLNCPVSSINGFEVRAGGGNDIVTVGKSVGVQVILVGGPGLDDLYGGARNDVLIGGPGGDKLVGRGGNDLMKGLGGEDLLAGGRGNDRLFGGKGADILKGGPGLNQITQ
jgi:hypothetical protein